jgi:hypothetical protein
MSPARQGATPALAITRNRPGSRTPIRSPHSSGKRPSRHGTPGAVQRVHRPRCRSAPAPSPADCGPQSWSCACASESDLQAHPRGCPALPGVAAAGAMPGVTRNWRFPCPLSGSATCRGKPFRCVAGMWMPGGRTRSRANRREAALPHIPRQDSITWPPAISQAVRYCPARWWSTPSPAPSAGTSAPTPSPSPGRQGSAFRVHSRGLSPLGTLVGPRYPTCCSV